MRNTTSCLSLICKTEIDYSNLALDKWVGAFETAGPFQDSQNAVLFLLEYYHSRMTFEELEKQLKHGYFFNNNRLLVSTITLALLKQEQQSHQSHQFRANPQVHIKQLPVPSLLLSHPPREAADLLQLSYLHSNRKVTLCFRRKEDIHSFLWKGLIPSGWCANLNDMQLCKK